MKSKRRYAAYAVSLLVAILIGCSYQPEETPEITISTTQGTESSVTAEQPAQATGDTLPTEPAQVTEATEPTVMTEITEITEPAEPATTTEPTQPPVTESAVPTESSQTESAATEPPVTEPPATEPPATEPPMTPPTEPPTIPPTEPTEPDPTEAETVPHTHNYAEEVVEATCQSQGYTQYTCACGDIYRDNYTDKVKHQYVTVETVWQTLEADGYQLIECIYGCGRGYTIVLPKLKEYIDIAELSRYGNAYAAQYGYAGNPYCCPENGAGYYPALRKKITSMEEGYQAVIAAIDSQYRFDIAYGVNTAGLPVNVHMEATEDPTVFYIYVYYGGDCE